MTSVTSTMVILEAIQQVVGSSSPEQPIALHEPDFRGTEAWSYVKDCLDTGWVSTAGKWVSRFEQDLASTGAALPWPYQQHRSPRWPCMWWG